MSATTARATGPSTADAAQIAPDVVVADDAASNVVNDDISAGVEEVKTAQAPSNQPEAAPAADAEEAKHRHKALTIARIRLSSAPAALKEKFAALAEAAKDAATVEECLKAVEESLPEFLQEKQKEAARSEHPTGEVFFRGKAEDITDEQAEEIAQRQLARSGLLRGQRVKVAD